VKKLVVIASFLSAFAATGFAQTTPAEAGAKLVAERDAAYHKAHPGSAKAQTPTAHTSAKHNKNANKSQHAKKSQHHNQHAKKSHHNAPKAA
jgi:hypothetical protein